MVIEQRLPEQVLNQASVHLGEYAWRAPVVYDVIEAAAVLRLAVVLGDPRLTLPQGVYEFEAPTAGEDEEMRRPGESWRAFVERAADEARRSLQRLLADRSWIRGEPYAPADLSDLEWVLYFVEES